MNLGDEPSFPGGLADCLSISRSTVYATLRWLERLPTRSVPWAFQDQRRGGGWYSLLGPDEDDFLWLAERLGTLERWAAELRRKEIDSLVFDEYFLRRHGVDRMTGEISDSRGWDRRPPGRPRGGRRLHP
jgi:hypothetical protein